MVPLLYNQSMINRWIIGIALGFGLLAGLAWLANNAAPGDRLYSLDRKIETWQYGWTRSEPTKQIAASLQQEERLVELARLVKLPNRQADQLTLANELIVSFANQPSNIDTNSRLYRRLEEIAARQYIVLQAIRQELSFESALAKSVDNWLEMRQPAYNSFTVRAEQEAARRRAIID